jgi:hypothetical protein
MGSCQPSCLPNRAPPSLHLCQLVAATLLATTAEDGKSTVAVLPDPRGSHVKCVTPVRDTSAQLHASVHMLQ